MRRTSPQPIDEAVLWLYEWIVDSYARYVLIRCARFTNRRAEAEQIASYTLLSTCLLVGELEHLGQLGMLVDLMADMIAEDAIRAGTKAPIRPDQADAMLMADERLRTLVDALNRLDQSTCELLVFRHVERMEVGDLARLLQRTPAEVRWQLARGEGTLAERLGARSDASTMSSPRVRALLAGLRTGLDTDLARRVGGCALACLVECSREKVSMRSRLSLS
jgi:hypothetical protein